MSKKYFERKDSIWFGVQKNPNDKAIKKASSFNHIIPSEDMSIEEYSTFLNCAKPYELELDVVSKDTYYKICKELNTPCPKPYPSKGFTKELLLRIKEELENI